MNTALSVLALLIALVALGLQLNQRRQGRTAADEELADLPEDALGLRHEVAALRAEARSSLRHLAVVRYDAFGDLGGQLSWSVALLDDHGDGTVLSSIQARHETRAYAKSITGWTSEQQLSPEEAEAVKQASAGRP
ncbi:MAG: hypothetical protein JWQ74_2327 [Marmoricola sp.]|nr:hypothetical protein [Marmoricola sp.]